MDKNWGLIAFLTSVLLVSNGVGLQSQNSEGESPEAGQVCIKDRCFSVEIAANHSQRQYGLMDRDNLDPEKGMLFLFEEEGNHRFWMKNTLIPLDIIWINSSQDIVYIERNAQSCTAGFCPLIDPGTNASYVLEINGGLSDKYDINAGDKVNISYIFPPDPRGSFLNKRYPVIHPAFWKFNRSFESVLDVRLNKRV